MEIPPSEGTTAAKRSKLWLALGLVAILLVGAVFLVRALLSPVKTFAMGKGMQSDDTEFTVGACAGTTDGPGSTFNAGLRSATWDEAGHLNINYGIATNCAAPFNYGGYKLGGDRLTLEYSIAWKSTTMADGKAAAMKTMCTCGYNLKYRISGLKKQKYAIDIVEVAKR